MPESRRRTPPPPLLEEKPDPACQDAACAAHGDWWGAPAGFPAPYWQASGAALYCGDVRAQLRRLPARSIHCCICSPPYWGLRRYLEEGHPDASNELGLEERPDCLGWATGARCGECYVCHMVEVFSEVRRVLRDDGTLWLNLGDSYNGSGGRGGAGKQWTNGDGKPDNRAGCPDIAQGNLVGVPWRVALALQAGGWVLRAAMPWLKRNSMPDSAENRPGRAVEDVFLFTKGGDYFYDGEAVKVPGTYPSSGGAVFGKPGADQNRRYDRPDYRRRNFRSGDLFLSSAGAIDAFDVPVASYKGSHFATFAPRLIVPMILAGTSECGACAACGAPYEPLIAKERTGTVEDDGVSRDRSVRDNRNGLNSTPHDHIGGGVSGVVGWRRACACRTDEVVPCVVLDPFTGSGTTVATALQLGRRGVGVDLSEAYLRDHAVPRVEAALSGEGFRGRRRPVIVPEVPEDRKSVV